MQNTSCGDWSLCQKASKCCSAEIGNVLSDCWTGFLVGKPEAGLASLEMLSERLNVREAPNATKAQPALLCLSGFLQSALGVDS